MTRRNTTFLSSLLANLKIVYTERLPTAAVDGVNIFINPNFVEDMPVDQVLGLLLHEIMHVAYEHLSRSQLKKLDPTLWNVAGDYVINNYLVNSSFQLPPGGLINHQFDGWSTREVYDHLEKNRIKIDLPMVDLLPPTDPQQEEVVITNVLKAAVAASLAGDAGSIPGDIARLVENLVNPVLPWQVILQNHLQGKAQDNYTWTRPNRRYAHAGLYLPAMESENLEQVTVAVDVSGSISQDQFDSFLSEIKYIKDTLKPKKLRFMTFDTRITYDQTFDEFEEIEDIQVRGRGGTRIGPVIDTLIKDTPELAIIFTDGEFSKPHLGGVASDIYWIINGYLANTFQVSVGTVIPFTED